MGNWKKVELEGEEDEGDGEGKEGGEEDEGDGEGEEGGDEDEGWLMDFVYFPSNHSSAWMVWNARDLSRVATVHLPQRVPYGVHGLWLDKQFFDSKKTVSEIN